MRSEEATANRGVSSKEELDELQRGQEQTLFVEDLDRGAPRQIGAEGPAGIPIPDPGHRPGAIRIGEHGDEASDR